jgi:hypothetical protein
MSEYRTFLAKLSRNYFLGSSITTMGVGGVLIYLVTLPVKVEISLLFTIFILCLAGMVTMNQMTFYRHLRPIRIYFKNPDANYEMLKTAYVQTHRFAILTAKRILGSSLHSYEILVLFTLNWHFANSFILHGSQNSI